MGKGSGSLVYVGDKPVCGVVAVVVVVLVGIVGRGGLPDDITSTLRESTGDSVRSDTEGSTFFGEYSSSVIIQKRIEVQYVATCTCTYLYSFNKL